MKRLGLTLALTLVAGLLLAATPGLPTSPAAPAVSSHLSASAAGALTGNITGPTVVSTGANQRYLIQATGGPAVAANGTIVGNLTYYASVTGNNLTGVQITPQSAAIVVGAPGRPLLQAGGATQTLTIDVELVSQLGTQNETLNLTYAVQVVTPYVVAAEIVNGNNLTVAPFEVLIALDGTPVGNVSVPSILPHAAYNLSFQYPTAGLSTGWHSFTLTLPVSHGLLRFSNGTSQYTASFYVPGPPPDNTLWYVTGFVAFIGVLFIFGARLGARRRSASKK